MDGDCFTQDTWEDEEESVGRERGGERATMRMRAGCKARTGQSGGEGEVSVQRRLPMRRECVWREKEDMTVVQKR